MHFVFRNPWNPLSNTTIGKNISAVAELFERMTRRYGKPTFGLDEIEVDGVVYPILEDVVWSRPFCNLLHFVRPDFPHAEDQPKLLIVAPMSGHYATLLRGTVEALLPYCDIYITDWTDARLVPIAVGSFDLDDYIDYLRLIMDHLGPGVHTLGVCQPGVPLLAAVAIMEANGDPNVPASMTFMGSPIDTRRSPTEVNKLAEKRGVEWFRRNVLHPVPFPYPGFGPAGLSGLPAAFRLHGDESRPPRQRPHRDVQPSRRGRRRLGGETPRLLRRVPGGDGHGRRLLHADDRKSVRPARAAEGRADAPRPARRLQGDPPVSP